MTLADLPHGAGCTIRRVGRSLKRSAYSVVAGIAPGNFVRVLARYPTSAPRFVEIEVAGALVVTLPLPLAREISLDCQCA